MVFIHTRFQQSITSRAFITAPVESTLRKGKSYWLFSIVPDAVVVVGVVDRGEPVSPVSGGLGCMPSFRFWRCSGIGASSCAMRTSELCLAGWLNTVFMYGILRTTRRNAGMQAQIISEQTSAADHIKDSASPSFVLCQPSLQEGVHKLQQAHRYRLRPA